MDKEQAFSILEQALNVANQKGAFLLGDAAVIQTALQLTREELKIPLPELAPRENDSPEDASPNSDSSGHAPDVAKTTTTSMKKI